MIWLIGRNGQLSRCFQHELKKRNISFVVSSSEEADITDENSIRSFVENKRITVVINCSAYTAVDKAESDTELAFSVNKHGARNISKLCNEIDAFLIHFSTDFIFSGSSTSPYLEEDEAAPINKYGESKLAGETEIKNISKNAAIFRVSWLYSPYGNNFLKTMIRLGRERSEINVVGDQIGSPTSAMEVSWQILENLESFKSLTGVEVFHLSNTGKASWCEFAKEIMIQHDLSCVVKPILTKDYPTPAKRPGYSVMSTQKVRNIIRGNLKPWTNSLQECSNFMKESPREK